VLPEVIFQASLLQYFDLPATLLSYVLSWFYQDVNRVAVLSAVGNGANVALDYLFIVHGGDGKCGAGSRNTAHPWPNVAVR